MDPIIEQLCRARELRPDVLRRMQRYFRDEIQPKLDELDALKAEQAKAKTAKKAVQA
jgi:hypothetical protein